MNKQNDFDNQNCILALPQFVQLFVRNPLYAVILSQLGNVIASLEIGNDSYSKVSIYGDGSGVTLFCFCITAYLDKVFALLHTDMASLLFA